MKRPIKRPSPRRLSVLEKAALGIGLGLVVSGLWSVVFPQPTAWMHPASNAPE